MSISFNFMCVVPSASITSGIILVPNHGNAVFFLMLWYQLFHHKGKGNLLPVKYFYPSVPQ